SDEDAQWVDEVKLANEINSIEDPNLRSLVWKLANEDKSRREAARRDVVNKYAASAIKTFWDTHSITKTLNSAEMQWLERNDLDEWNRVREQIERWAERWRREARAIRSEQRAEERLQLSRQARADKDPENIRLLYELREDMLLNPLKYAAEDYGVDALAREWGLRIPGPFHNQMFEALEKHKRGWAQEDYRLAMDRFRSWLTSRSNKFADANERRAFVAAMWSLYEQELAAGKKLTSEDVDRLIHRAETQVKTKGFIFTSEKPYYKAIMSGDNIISYYDPSTDQWIEGAPPPGAAIRVYNRDGEVEEDVPA